jgi:tetratricopeptide (TPR) repeat protein
MGRLQVDVIWRQAKNAFDANDMSKAQGLCEELLQRNKRNFKALAMLGQVHFARNNLDEAAALMQKASSIEARDPRPYLVLAEIRTFQGRYKEAITLYDKVLRLQPEYHAALAGKADAYEKSAQRGKARGVLEPYVRTGRETPVMAITQARVDMYEKNYEAVIKLATRHIRGGRAKGYVLGHLCALLGQAYERTKMFDEAFEAYAATNKTVPAPFDAGQFRQRLNEIIEAFSPQQLERVPRATHGSKLPVFIVGMPRCGSTLTETILDAHPDVAGAGESTVLLELITSISIDIGSNLPYPACIEDLDQSDVNTVAQAYLDRIRSVDRAAKRIADKQLANYLNVGLISILFPQGRIIHCHRHPLDTCFSCFVNPLSPTNHPYSCDLRSLGFVYTEYERLMAHWRRLGIPMLEVRYEDLVADPENRSREIIDFCGLDWDDRCLRFHEKKRLVQTASYAQVTKPIYKSSMARYKSFEKHLGPLKEALADGGWTEEAFEKATVAGLP